LPVAFDPRTAAIHRAEEQPAQRLVNNSEHTCPIFNQSYLDSKISITIDETICPVERVDHPHSRFNQSMLSVN
jgi:hypothetical protein